MRVMKMTLEQWLDYQLKTHPQAIAMGLERVREVARRLGLGRPASHVITVGGTNGKGSTVAFIESIARAGGLRVGAFTSPHLLRYNERIRVDGAEVDDATLVDAFERIESARAPGSESTRPEDATVPLTYFEFGTLAALLVFEQSKLDIAILEVGLGGKLDAVNIVDPDVAVITTVGIDHQEYLGVDREAIGADKAGILRARQAVRVRRKGSAVLGAAARLRDRRVRDSRARRLPGRHPRPDLDLAGARVSKSICQSQAWALRRRSTTRRLRWPHCARCRCRSRTRRWWPAFARRGSPAGCRFWPSRRKSWSM